MTGEPLSDGTGYEFYVSEWWDQHGDHHQGSPLHWHDNEPNWDAMIDNEDGELFPTQMTGHIVWEDGNERHYTLFSPDGWTQDELDSEVDDSASYYETTAG